MNNFRSARFIWKCIWTKSHTRSKMGLRWCARAPARAGLRCGLVLRLPRLWVCLAALSVYPKRNFPGWASCGPFTHALVFFCTQVSGGAWAHRRGSSVKLRQKLPTQLGASKGMLTISLFRLRGPASRRSTRSTTRARHFAWSGGWQYRCAASLRHRFHSGQCVLGLPSVTFYLHF